MQLLFHGRQIPFHDPVECGKPSVRVTQVLGVPTWSAARLAVRRRCIRSECTLSSQLPNLPPIGYALTLLERYSHLWVIVLSYDLGTYQFVHNPTLVADMRPGTEPPKAMIGT